MRTYSFTHIIVLVFLAISSLLHALSTNYTKQWWVAEQTERAYGDNATEQEIDPERKIYFFSFNSKNQPLEIQTSKDLITHTKSLFILNQLIESLHICLPPPNLA